MDERYRKFNKKTVACKPSTQSGTKYYQQSLRVFLSTHWSVCTLMQVEVDRVEYVTLPSRDSHQQQETPLAQGSTEMAQRHLEQNIKDSHFQSKKPRGRQICNGSGKGKSKGKAKNMQRTASEEAAHIGSPKVNVLLKMGAHSNMTQVKGTKRCHSSRLTSSTCKNGGGKAVACWTRRSLLRRARAQAISVHGSRCSRAVCRLLFVCKFYFC